MAGVSLGMMWVLLGLGWVWPEVVVDMAEEAVWAWSWEWPRLASRGVVTMSPKLDLGLTVRSPEF